MRISTILFDAGGVLVVPLDPVANAQRRDRLAQNLGFSDGEAMWEHFYGGDTWIAAKTGEIVHTEMWQTLLTPLGVVSPEAQQEFLAQLYDDEGILPEMRLLVERLHGDYRLGILSNWDDRLEEILEDELGIAHYFDAIVNSHRIGVAKPDEEAYLEALDQLRVEPQEVLFIDDRSRNTNVAAELGIHTHVYRDFDILVMDLEERGIIDGSETFEIAHS